MRGFTLIEVLVSTLIAIAVSGALFQLMDPARLVFQPQLEAADAQQRLRVGADMMVRDLIMAGAGPTVGPNVGPLWSSTAPVMPYRHGSVGDDPALGVFYRPDAVTVIFVPSTASPGTVVSRTYYAKPDSATGALQLMQYNGDQGDFPLIDNVVALGFEYGGDPQPPETLPPPSFGIDPDAQDEYPAGENCLFARVDGAAVPRLNELSLEPALVLLAPAILTDGPWCPNAMVANRFDADLLRIRRISVRLRVQVGSGMFRGPVGVLFTRAGTATRNSQLVPDREIRVDVTPRNLNVSR
jgi:hypothetical protein